jgi:hypothetical protein
MWPKPADKGVSFESNRRIATSGRRPTTVAVLCRAAAGGRRPGGAGRCCSGVAGGYFESTQHQTARMPAGVAGDRRYGQPCGVALLASSSAMLDGCCRFRLARKAPAKKKGHRRSAGKRRRDGCGVQQPGLDTRRVGSLITPSAPTVIPRGAKRSRRIHPGQGLRRPGQGRCREGGGGSCDRAQGDTDPHVPRECGRDACLPEDRRRTKKRPLDGGLRVTYSHKKQ